MWRCMNQQVYNPFLHEHDDKPIPKTMPRMRLAAVKSKPCNQKVKMYSFKYSYILTNMNIKLNFFARKSYRGEA